MSKEPNRDAPTPIIVPVEAGPVLKAFGDTVQVKLAAEHTGGNLMVGLCEVPPGGGPPPHLHRNEDEMFLILEGSYRFLADGEWVEVGPGGLVYIPRGAVHTFQNAGDTISRHWVLNTPSGFEAFFGKCATVFAAAEGGPPDMPQIMGICGEHGIEFVPPLQSPPQGPPHGADA